jgi:hypothetical protein
MKRRFERAGVFAIQTPISPSSHIPSRPSAPLTRSLRHPAFPLGIIFFGMFRGLACIRRQTGASRVDRGKLPFYLALGYLIWSILPHAAFRVHEHAGGSAAHAHLSFHDAGLRVGAAVTANPPELAPSLFGSADSMESPAQTSSGVSAGSGLESLDPLEPRAAHPQSFKPENPRHGHFTEDDNILAAGITVARSLLPVPHPVPGPASVLSPLLPYSGPATARGPPSRA